MELSLITICLVAACMNYAACCDSGRIFLGSVNETYPELVDTNGIYIRQANDIDGLPLYKHESGEHYLYHVSGNLISSFWVIGTTPGSLSGTVSLQTSATGAEHASEKWRIWNSRQGSWVEEKHFKAKCVDESFVTCTTGRLHLHELSPWNQHQNNRTGYYYLTNETHEMRPVYQNEYQTDYLFYVDGLWMVGPEVGKVSAGLFVLDYAWRPEYIIETWIVFNGKQFLRDPKLYIRCAGNVADVQTATEESEEQIDIDDILTIAQGVLGDDDVDLHVCGQYYCENGGTCISNEVGDFLCACPEHYLGARCERTVECGSPPEVANAEVVTQTGKGFHALAFYKCADDFIQEGPTAVTCGENGEWTHPPSCFSWLDHISPGVVAASARKRRQHFMTLARRHVNHRRRVRSLLPVDINKMKALFK